MQLSSIILARTLAYVEGFDLDPKGKISIPDLVKAIGDRYKFRTLPKWEVRDKDGLIFEDGKIGNRVIKKLTLYDVLITLETRSNTSDSKELVIDLLEWGAAKFGLNYSPALIKKFAYVSDLTFYSHIPVLDNACAPLSSLAAKTSEALSRIWNEPLEYRPITLSAGHDPLVRKYGIAPFTITRRLETPFPENKYFSEAPLPTDLHIEFLEQFERDVEEQGRDRTP
jgi:hypothetical protein